MPHNFKSTQFKTFSNILFYFNKGVNLSYYLHSLLVSDNREERKMATQIIIDLDAVHKQLNIKKKLNSSISLPTVAEIKTEIFNKLILEHPEIFDRKPCDLIVPNIKDIESWLAPVLILCCYDQNSQAKCQQLLNNFFPFVKCNAQSNRFYTVSATLLYSSTDYFPLEYKIEKAKTSIPQDIKQYQRCSWISKIWLSVNDTEENSKERFLQENLLFMVKLMDVKLPETATKFMLALSCYFPKEYIGAFIKVLSYYTPYYRMKQEYIWFYIYLISAAKRYAKNFKEENSIQIKDYLKTIAQLLWKLLNNLRQYRGSCWDELRAKTMHCMHHLDKFIKFVRLDDLQDEIDDINPRVVRQACLTLTKFNGLAKATQFICIAASKDRMDADTHYLILSNALKWLAIGKQRNKKVVETLEDQMHRGTTLEIKDSARRLLAEMGGYTAIQKLSHRESMKERYAKEIKIAQDKVEKMFQESMHDARLGFQLALIMDSIVFLFGVAMLAASGIIAVTTDSVSVWAGVGISGGSGSAAVLYTLFVGKPREKVKEATNHMMKLKMVFLGYLRELSQMDQTFSRRLLDEDPIEESEIKFYTDNLHRIMHRALNELKQLKNYL